MRRNVQHVDDEQRKLDTEKDKHCSHDISQEALLLHSDRETRLSVEILQLRIIPFKKDCNR